MKGKINFYKRFLLRIGWLRRYSADKSFNSEIETNKLTNVINRTLSTKLAYNVTSLVNERRIDAGVFFNKKYYQTVIVDLFGKKGKIYAEQLRIEKANIKSFPNLHITLVHTPSTGEVGQCSIIAFLHESWKPVQAYILEHSFEKKYVVTQWQEDKLHVNYGNADDKIQFVKRIAELYNCEDSSGKQSFDELDLKHRLAREIGVKVEHLDMYMKIFQEKVTMEMQGIDSSGIDERIENLEEWGKYCQWEIQQAHKRMSPEDLEVSRRLFEQWLERDHQRGQANMN